MRENFWNVWWTFLSHGIKELWSDLTICSADGRNLANIISEIFCSSVSIFQYRDQIEKTPCDVRGQILDVRYLKRLILGQKIYK